MKNHFLMIKGKLLFAILNWEVDFLMIKGKQMFAIYFWKLTFLRLKGKIKNSYVLFSGIFPCLGSCAGVITFSFSIRFQLHIVGRWVGTRARDESARR